MLLMTRWKNGRKGKKMRLIDETELKEWVENWFYQHKYYHPYSKSNSIPCSELYDILERLPTIDAVEAKHGEWIDEKNGYYWFGKCSSCRKEFAIDGWYASDMNYCPNCGAKMDGGEE